MTVNPNSLANLNPKARYQGKVRCNLTLMPDTVQWLKGSGNASQRIEELVTMAKTNDNSDNTHNQDSEEVTMLKKRIEELEHGIADIVLNTRLGTKGYKRNSFSQGIKDLEALIRSETV